MGASVQSSLNTAATGLGEWNLGIMTALQFNPSDTTSTCYTATTTTNTAIVDALDISSYPSGTFDFFTLLDLW